MENGTELASKSKKLSPKIIGVIVLLFLIASAGVASYLWQHKKVNNLNVKVSQLQTQIDAATKSSDSMQKKPTLPNTFIYSPKTGGLSLTLPKTYGIIVNVDGNAGGAPGATFRVGMVTSSNIFTDFSYQGVGVDITDTFTSLDRAVESEESILNNQQGTGSTQNRNYQVSNTTVAGLPAKLITADGLDEYQGSLSVYLVGSGSFMYTITANGTQADSFDLLTAVLKGVSIKSVTL